MVEHINDYIGQVDTKHWYGDELDKGLAKHLHNAGYRTEIEWISVDEMLPERNGSYVVLDGRGRMIVAPWCENVGWFSPARCVNPITHWLPLPSHPAKE